jgi:Site-specific recombinases, DNA invertase Pin homologs
MNKYIAYLRVSTKRQGQSGLGLEAQRESIRTYVERNGGEIIAEFVEVKSGTSRKRKEIKAAVELSCKEKAVLIVAKLDRLARDTEYAHYIKNTAYEICAVDLPSMNKMVFGMFALMAEYERDLISERTKQALQAKKARGWKSKHARFNVGATGAGAQSRWEDKIGYDPSTIELLRGYAKDNLSLREMASRLNAAQVKTLSGTEFKAMTVKRILCEIKQ